MNKKDVYAVVILAAGWLAIIFAVGIGGDVAVDDSWDYAAYVKHFLESGEILISPYTSAVPLLHILWGSLICKVIGFSFAACRVANLAAALIALLLVYWFCRKLGLSTRGAFWATAATVASPPFLVISFTFVYEIWFLIPAWAAVGFFLRYLQNERDLDLFLSSLLCGLTLWNKVHGVFLIFALLVFLVARTAKNGLQWWKTCLWMVMPLISFYFFSLTKSILHPVHTTLDRKWDEVFARLTDPSKLFADGLERTFVVILCLGAYALPLLIAGGWRARRSGLPKPVRTGLGTFSVLLVGIAAAYWIIMRGQLFPFTSSVLREWPPLTHKWILGAWTLLGCLGAVWVMHHFLAGIVEAWREKRQGILLLALCTVLFIGVMVPLVLFMDRYYIVFTPFAFAIVWWRMTRIEPVDAGKPAPPENAESKGKPVLTILAVLLLLTIIGLDGLRVRQYRNGVEAQWRAADRLVAEGVDPIMIDGGYSWFGWNNYPRCWKDPQKTYQVSKFHSHYVIETCPWAPIKYDVVFHEMSPPRTLVRTSEYRDPFGQENRVYVYQRPGFIP